MSIEATIDDLYRQGLDAFVPARNALAKGLSGADAKRVRALAKPTVVAWAVNQVYWRARPLYDKVIKSGSQLRAAQIASLEGRRSADVRNAGEAHRRALADAVKEAERLGTEAGASPAPDTLSRTFEALSLASGSPEPPGRLTKPLQPAGFEALAGVTPVPREEAALEREQKPDRKKERAAAEAARREAAAVAQAEAALARAEAAEHRAREVWDRAHDELLKTRQALRELKQSPTRSS